MNEQNVIIVTGDLGAGSNLLKNILLLSDQCHWPAHAVDSKIDFLINQIYPSKLKYNLSNWLEYEYKLRSWEKFYSVDISNQYQDIATDEIKKITQHSTVVFISHWASVTAKLIHQYPDIKRISLYPRTRAGLLWQIKTYIDKIGIENLQNFSFPDNINKNKKTYIEQHGLEQYYKFNVSNMVEIMHDRSKFYKSIDGHAIAIEDLVENNENLVLEEMIKYSGCKVDLATAQKIHDHWKQLHKPSVEVNDYVWFGSLTQY